MGRRLPASAVDDTLKKVLVAESPSLLENNRRFHRPLVDGIDVEYARPDGCIAGDKVWLVDFDDPEADDWLAINQFTVVEGKTNRGRDVVVFVQGRLPAGQDGARDGAGPRAGRGRLRGVGCLTFGA